MTSPSFVKDWVPERVCGTENQYLQAWLVAGSEAPSSLLERAANRTC